MRWHAAGGLFLPYARAFPAGDFRQAGQKSDGRADDVRVAEDLVVAEAARRQELRSRPRGGECRAFLPGNAAVSLVVHDQHRGGRRVGTDQTQVFPRHAVSRNETPLHRVSHRRRDLHVVSESRGVRLRVDRRRQENGSPGGRAAPEGEGRGGRSHRMAEDARKRPAVPRERLDRGDEVGERRGRSRRISVTGSVERDH